MTTATFLREAAVVAIMVPKPPENPLNISLPRPFAMTAIAPGRGHLQALIIARLPDRAAVAITALKLPENRHSISLPACNAIFAMTLAPGYHSISGTIHLLTRATIAETRLAPNAIAATVK